jgi:hypothetical protein
MDILWSFLMSDVRVHREQQLNGIWFVQSASKLARSIVELTRNIDRQRDLLDTHPGVRYTSADC